MYPNEILSSMKIICSSVSDSELFLKTADPSSVLLLFSSPLAFLALHAFLLLSTDPFLLFFATPSFALLLLLLFPALLLANLAMAPNTY